MFAREEVARCTMFGTMFMITMGLAVSATACNVPLGLSGGRTIDLVMGAGRQARGRITVVEDDAGMACFVHP